MPTINQNTEINITPERFLKACSDLELFELDNLLQRPVYQNRIAGMFGDIEAEHTEVKPLLFITTNHPLHLCPLCGSRPVDLDNKQEYCSTCLENAPTYQS